MFFLFFVGNLFEFQIKKKMIAKDLKEPIFKKVKSQFDELSMEYTVDHLSSDFFSENNASFAKDMVVEINNKCNKFIDFKYFLKYRQYTIFSMFFILPLMFLLGVIGFTSEAFILSWFFFTFLFFSMFLFFLILYYLSARINKQFFVYSQQIQEIIDRYNTEWLIERNIFAYFRTKSVDSWQNKRNSNSNSYAQNQKGQISLKFKFFVQSRLLRIIRNFFWIEFLRFSEAGEVSQPQFKPSSSVSPPKKIIKYNDSPIQPVSELKKSPHSQNPNRDNSGLEGSNAKSNQNPEYTYNAKGSNKSNLSPNSQIMAQKTPERREVIENDQVLEPGVQRGSEHQSNKEQSNPRGMYKNESPDVIKFEESPDAKSQIKSIGNNDIEGTQTKKYFNEEEQGRVDEDEEIAPAESHSGLKGKNNQKKDYEDDEFE